MQSPHGTAIGRPGLHGRDAEVRWLAAALSTARRGAGILLAVEGAAGTGKSRLVQETRVRARACGGRVLATRALGADEGPRWHWRSTTSPAPSPQHHRRGGGQHNPLIGQGGDDVIHGGSGNDALYGDAGNDTLDGGTGDDDLDGIPGGEPPGLDTSGADTYIGGGGSDSVDYSLRSEDLHLSPDGIANDGAAGERDNIGADVATIVGGNGNDTITGTTAATRWSEASGTTC